MKAIGALLDATVKIVDVLQRTSPTRLVELRKIRVVLSFSTTLLLGDLPKLTSDGQTKDPRRQASELREKLLREKIKKMRTLSTDSMNAQANAQ